MTEKLDPKCALCPTRICENNGAKMDEGPPSTEKLPGFCPMKIMPDVFIEAAVEYKKPEIGEFAGISVLRTPDPTPQGKALTRRRTYSICCKVQLQKIGYRPLRRIDKRGGPIDSNPGEFRV